MGCQTSIDQSLHINRRVEMKLVNLETEIQFVLINMLLGFKDPEAGGGDKESAAAKPSQKQHRVLTASTRQHAQGCRGKKKKRTE